ncbi:MAG: peptidylprolyl isomerase [Gammaproteobacteria bacterium]
MEIARNKVVTFHYVLTDENGERIESSEEKGRPATYLHGRNNLLPGLEAELQGKRAGDQLKVTVPPELGYGLRIDDAVKRVPIKHLVRPGKLSVGKVVTVNTTAGPRPATVTKVGRFNVDVDFNHPLAGKTLVFDVKILDVRDATDEEIAHGHAHGPGGHEHA